MKTPYPFKELRRRIGNMFGQAIGPEGFKEVMQDARERGAFQNAEIQKVITEILLYLEANSPDENKTVQSDK
jgi:hypothetical protein